MVCILVLRESSAQRYDTYLLRTTYHMPYARGSHLGIPPASCGVPPNPLETDRI